MPTDATIALGAQVFNPMKSLSDVLGTAQQIQGLQNSQLQNQQGQIDLQNKQRTLDERGHITRVLSNIKQYQTPGGSIDYGRLSSDVLSGAPSTGMEAVQSVANMEQQGIAAKNAINGLDTATRGQVASWAYGQIDRPLPDVMSAADQLAQNFPTLTPAVANLKQTLSGARSPEQIRAALIQAGREVLTAPQQQDAKTPTGVQVTNGQVASLVNQRADTPLAIGAALPNTQVQLQPPPTTPIIGADGKPRLYGAQPSMVVGSAGPQSSYAPGEQEGVTGPVATNNQHYAEVQQSARTAPTRIAALQTIKQEVPVAITGGGGVGDFLRSASRIFGFANDAATANDVMAKNLAVLAGQSGNTDAARGLAEMATPNYKMTEKAALKTIDQLVGIEHKNQAASSFFANTPTNSPEYTNKLTMWSKYGDPRAFEYAAKSPAEQSAMKAEMVKAGTWKTLQDSMRHLHMMGVDPQ